MQRYGRTATGRVRWYCPSCMVSTVRHRSDTHRRHLQRQFRTWLLGVESLRALARKIGVTRRTLTAWFEPLWNEPLPQPQPVDVTGQILIADGVRLASAAWVLVGRTHPPPPWLTPPTQTAPSGAVLWVEAVTKNQHEIALNSIFAI